MEITEKKKVQIERVLGIVLLIPPVIGVLLFLINLFFDRPGDIPELENLSREWTGTYGDNGGYTSAAPIYLGLMAIAGAILLKGTDRSKVD